MVVLAGPRALSRVHGAREHPLGGGVLTRGRRLVRRALLAAALALAATACAPPPDATAEARAFVTLAGNPDTAEEIVVAIPGALTTVSVFWPLTAWADADTAVVAWRFPGLDGRPAEDRVRILPAASAIAAYANARKPRAVRLIGLSTGAAIALEAAREVRAEQVDVALISPALPTPAVVLAGAAAAADMVEAAARADTWETRALFAEYYRTLLYGRSHYRDPVRAGDSARRAAEVRDGLILPEKGRARSHGAGLVGWALGRPEELSHVRVAIFAGSEDPLFPLAAVRRFAARLPQATLHVYRGQGHLLFSTVPDLFGDIRRAMRR
jgi:pimeloyl-ACP methyl ester carboxylesterase